MLFLSLFALFALITPIFGPFPLLRLVDPGKLEAAKGGQYCVACHDLVQKVIEHVEGLGQIHMNEDNLQNEISGAIQIVCGTADILDYELAVLCEDAGGKTVKAIGDRMAIAVAKAEGHFGPIKERKVRRESCECDVAEGEEGDDGEW